MNKKTKKEEVQQTQTAKFISSSRVYNILAQEGHEEIERPNSALLWSGLVAGLCISFSLLAETFLEHHLPEFEGAFLISNFGYCVGFTMVILGRFQLFTENTISAVLPLLHRKDMRTLTKTARIWLLVFLANMIGTLTMAAMCVFTKVISPDVLHTMSEISHHAVDRDAADIFVQAIPAGFLVATITWLLPNSQYSKFAVLIMMTYLIAIGDFAHVIVGSCEVFVLVLQSELSVLAGATYIGSAAAGNIIGGTFLFSLMAYAQVRQEIAQDAEEQAAPAKPYKVAQSMNT